MNAKNIGKALKKKIDDWVSNIDDEAVKEIVADSAIITGGALVSLLNNEKPNDYDVYFKTEAACRSVAEYYAKVWNKTHKDKSSVSVENKDGRVTAFIQSNGVVMEDGESGIDDETEPDVGETDLEQKDDKPR